MARGAARIGGGGIREETAAGPASWGGRYDAGLTVGRTLRSLTGRRALRDVHPNWGRDLRAQGSSRSASVDIRGSVKRPSEPRRPSSSCTGTARRSATHRVRAALPAVAADAAGCHVGELDRAFRVDEERCHAWPRLLPRRGCRVPWSALGRVGEHRERQVAESLWVLRHARCTIPVSVLAQENLAVRSAHWLFNRRKP